jgi:hypothetical protein
LSSTLAEIDGKYLGSSEAAYLSSLFDVGGIVGVLHP